jgi:dihydrofolate synthase/folylpolyglutamate synthase
MPRITNFAEAHEALRRFYRKDTTYTLDRMRALMDYLGNPQDDLKIIHVAGTSGKTSTAYYTAALLKAAGCKVGLTVSPHVDEVNERVQIDLTPMPETKFCAALSEFIEKVDASEIVPSYFELMVAFSYWQFSREKVDYAVIEVGLGGLLDGTNVVDREDKVCIITDIGLDHTEVLGDTLAKIATQKAGIIQSGNEVFMYCQDEEVMEVVERVCKRQSATLHIALQLSPSEATTLPLFQQRNFHLAAQAVTLVLQRAGQTMTNEQRKRASETYIPARMEIIEREDGKTIVIDGAHNEQKLHTLFESITTKYPGEKIAALVGFVESDAFRLEHNIEELTGQVERIIATSFYSEKDYPKYSVAPSVVAAKCQRRGYKNVQVCEKPADAWQLLLSSPEPILLVTGSFYLLNHIRPLLYNKEER